MSNKVLLFTKHQYCKNYLNIASSKKTLHSSAYNNIICTYNNLAFVKLNLQIFKLKNTITLILNNCMQYNMCVPLVVNTIKNKFAMIFYKKFYKKRRVSYFLGPWWNGLIRNFNVFINHKKNKKQFFFYKNKFPTFCLYYGHQFNMEIDKRSKNIFLESNFMSLNSIYFINSTNNYNKTTDGIICNTKSMVSNLFINKNFFLQIIKNSKNAIKKKFIMYVLNKWKIIILKSSYRLLYYEFFFNSKYILEKKIWENI